MIPLIPATRLGRYVETIAGGESVRAFVPPPLPPSPALHLTPLLRKLGEADRALGRLDGLQTVSEWLPSHELLLEMYVRKEALLSSQIEGTQSTLTDLLRFESDQPADVPDDTREVSNYVDALTYGLKRLESLPLSLRLIQELHAQLLNSGRGASATPGEFRRTQNWIGGSRPANAHFVPPPLNELQSCLNDFELFLHEEDSGLPPLIKAGLIHVQFEAIHPFLDGNGRLGRLLVTLYLCANKHLSQPALYLSLFLKTHRTAYYEHLQAVREHGAWEEWLSFFLDAVIETAHQAVQTATRIVSLFAEDQKKIELAGERVTSCLRIHEAFKRWPFASAVQLCARAGLAFDTVNLAIGDLERLGILREITGRRRGRVFLYHEYLSLLEEGTQPLSA